MNELQGIDSNDIIVFMVAGILVILLSFAFILYFILSYRNKQKAYALLQLQKGEIDNQKIALEKALHELKITQNQLIQSGKLASLGELTAGIAHEIQNPLNFVNNFSDVSVELIAEMRSELAKGDTTAAIQLADDIEQNLQIINHHGRRADSIVKGMLQHSRTSSGQKEPTNINVIADQYLHLAYHGRRAKVKSFNAELVKDFEPNLPLANVIPQDIGRVLLNLFTNAFYATQQKQETAGPDYRPIVRVTTSSTANGIEIRVYDNGTGIPDAIRDKVMQPFFTTKPAGEGTGLGLSLCYDIVVKGHGGEMTIDSVADEHTTISIFLPT